MSKYLDPTNDVAFKKVFMNEGRLMDFLNAMLRRPEGSRIKEIEFLPQDLVPDRGQGKRGMFDIKCKDQSGHRFIIEMQNENKPYFLERVQFYGAHTYVSQLELGKPHSGLLPVVVVVVIKEGLFPDDLKCISFHRMAEVETNKSFLNGLSYAFVELEKFKKTAQELETTEDYWLYFLTHSMEIKEPPATIHDKWVLEAYETITQFNWNADEYDAYIRAKLAAEAEVLAVDEVTAEARAEGKAEERAEAYKRTLATAKTLLAGKVDIKLIAQSTGLSEEEIRSLK